MTLPASGAISLGQVAVELGRLSTAAIDLNESAVRTLFAKPSGAISLADGYGKTYYALGTVLQFTFANYGTSGQFTVEISGANPGAVITLELTATNSGQSLGFTSVGTCSGAGYLFYSPGIPNTDPYWYPAVCTNTFTVWSDGTHSLGSFTAHS